jgi:putative transposase
MMNAIFYVMRGGCSWRLMPHDFPPWQSVYTQYRTWKRQGVFEKIHHFIREELRQLLGRHKEASAAIIDSQSIKTTERGALQALMELKR